MDFVDDCASVFDLHFSEEFVYLRFRTTLFLSRRIKFVDTLFIPRCCSIVCNSTEIYVLTISAQIWQNTV